jgi:hypothetical protein
MDFLDFSLFISAFLCYFGSSPQRSPSISSESSNLQTYRAPLPPAILKLTRSAKWKIYRSYFSSPPFSGSGVLINHNSNLYSLESPTAAAGTGSIARLQIGKSVSILPDFCSILPAFS